jgi:acyl-CoA thioesterase II
MCLSGHLNARSPVGSRPITPGTVGAVIDAQLPPADLRHVFELEAHGRDVWVGESPSYPWGRIYGGLVVAQALWAATQTVDPEHGVHSLHGYFILAGDPREPVRYEVDRLRNGRSFTTRQVVARQSGGAIFNLACSFQRHEEGVETQTATFPADAPAPGTFTTRRTGSGLDCYDVPLPPRTPRSLVWARYPAPLPDDPRVHACALAYITDTNAMDAIGASHPHGIPTPEEKRTTFMTASLDHALWFHRPMRADDWVLLDLDGHGIIRTRGLSTGHAFAAGGQHVATIAQQGLIRQLTPRTS